MIDYTPHHQYKEIVDYIPERKKVVKGKIIGYALLLTYITLIGWISIRIMEKTTIWSFFPDIIVLAVLSLVMGIFFMLIYGFSSPGRPRLKSDFGNIIKSIVGVDFGEDYKLLYTSSHDYEEYLYIFSETSFLPFRDYLESLKDGEIEGTSRCVSHAYKDEAGKGFTLVENRLQNGGGNIERLLVDYEERTMKHTFTVY